MRVYLCERDPAPIARGSTVADRLDSICIGRDIHVARERERAVSQRATPERGINRGASLSPPIMHRRLFSGRRYIHIHTHWRICVYTRVHVCSGGIVKEYIPI